ncbi:MAG: IS66 family insertion sequence element accessory protein TnpB [Tatlockia sp.]|nr:IS66 family insertion sequence element accessory protein TnpB [Tatlockia sp.]
MLIPDTTKVHLYCGITDMRKSINTLAILVKDVFGMEITTGDLFLFRSRGGDKLKALYYEEQSFTLWYRRLEKGKFIFPRNTKGHIELTKEHLTWLMASNKFTFHQGEKPVIYRDFY